MLPSSLLSVRARPSLDLLPAKCQRLFLVQRPILPQLCRHPSPYFWVTPGFPRIRWSSQLYLGVPFWSSLILSWSLRVCVCSVAQSCLTLATPWTVAHQAPLSMGFSRQEYWSGLLCPTPGDLPNPGVAPWFAALVGGFLTTSVTWGALFWSLLLSNE